ncbi:hypothetical protein ACFFGH_17590 [Lysobacter korlensis]|uniref:Uncharacterized protein n=1 Tax=Lysobacter korlensis TaxID=553636 RepID=A0ABV6RRP7_9GAMM
MSNQNQSPLTSNSGTASARRGSMTGPDTTQSTDDRLHKIDAEARGESLDDHQRDRQANGVTDGYDDSLETRKGNEDTDYLGIARGD